MGEKLQNVIEKLFFFNVVVVVCVYSDLALDRSEVSCFRERSSFGVRLFTKYIKFFFDTIVIK